MEYVKAIILGLIQGLTEFLPVSSSGHLVLFQNLFGIKEAGIAGCSILGDGNITIILDPLNLYQMAQQY